MKVRHIKHSFVLSVVYVICWCGVGQLGPDYRGRLVLLKNISVTHHIFVSHTYSIQDVPSPCPQLYPYKGVTLFRSQSYVIADLVWQLFSLRPYHLLEMKSCCSNGVLRVLSDPYLHFRRKKKKTDLHIFIGGRVVTKRRISLIIHMRCTWH